LYTLPRTKYTDPSLGATWFGFGLVRVRVKARVRVNVSARVRARVRVRVRGVRASHLDERA